MANRDTSSTADVDTPDLIKKTYKMASFTNCNWFIREKKRTVTYQATEHYTVFQTFVYGRN